MSAHVFDEEEPKCVCSHGEARHTANEVPRGRCDVTLDLVMVGQHVKGRCSCRVFRLQLQSGEKR